MQRPDPFQVGPAFGPGSVVGDYRLADQIGAGGMGVVFRATQLTLEREVALKIINPLLAMDEEVRQRFVREARTGAAVEQRTRPQGTLPFMRLGRSGSALEQGRRV
jgi:serine/threonine protein kinase